MLSQLSYSPTNESSYRWAAGLSKRWIGASERAAREVLAASEAVVSCRASGRSGETGIRRGLKIPRLHGRAGSNPASGTARTLRFSFNFKRLPRPLASAWSPATCDGVWRATNIVHVRHKIEPQTPIVWSRISRARSRPCRTSSRRKSRAFASASSSPRSGSGSRRATIERWFLLHTASNGPMPEFAIELALSKEMRAGRRLASGCEKARPITYPRIQRWRAKSNITTRCFKMLASSTSN
jgi:hypothetical protein